MKKLIVSLMLIAMSAFAAESAPSAKVGYVKYPVVLGNTYVALPVPDAAFATASSFYAASANKITTVTRFLSATQKWDSAVRSAFGTWSNNFAVASGQAYLVAATGASEIVVDGSLAVNPAYNLVTGNNALMVPLSKATMTTASTYYTETTNKVTTVSRYLTATQKWDSAVRSAFGTWSNNFAIAIADPHLVSATGAVTWPTGGGKVEENNDPYVNFMPKSDTKHVIFGFTDRLGAEYDATTVANCTYKAWLTQGTGVAVSSEIIRSTDGTTFCDVYMYPDPIDMPLRGGARIDLQNFAAWGLNNVLNMTIKDENGGYKVMYEAYPTYTITDVSGLAAELGFEDYLGFGGFPWSLNTPSSIEDSVLPAETKLHQNYPNPFNPTTTIKFDLAKESVVKLNVYNYNGQLVRSLVDGQMNAGYHAVNFDASSLSAGVYYYTMETAGMTKTNKMVLVK